MSLSEFNTKQSWTDDELGFLADYEHLTNKQIAAELGRTVSSVKCKRRLVRRGWSPTLEPWTKDDDAFVLETPHLTAKRVAELMGRTEGAVSARRRLLGEVKGVKFDPIALDPFVMGARPLIAQTCEKCGLLLQADWFRHNRGPGGKYWPKACARCRTPRKRGGRGEPNATNERNQRLTRPHAKRQGQLWLDSEHQVLRDPDLTLVEKALRLGRTYYSIKAICQSNDYKSKVGLGDPERDQWIIYNPNEPLFPEQSAA